MLPKTHRLKCSELPGQLADPPDGIWRKIKLPDTGKYIKSEEQLRNTTLEWSDRPELTNFTKAVDTLGLRGQPLGASSATLNLASPKKLCEWLEGQWLE